MPLNIAFIKERRTQLTLTMEEAAMRAERFLRAAGHKHRFTRQRWNDLEKGTYPDCRLSTLEAFAAVLDCSLNDLSTPARRAGAR